MYNEINIIIPANTVSILQPMDLEVVLTFQVLYLNSFHKAVPTWLSIGFHYVYVACIQPMMWATTSVEGFLLLFDNQSFFGHLKAHSKLSWSSLLPWFFLPPCQTPLCMHIISQTGKDLGRLYLELLCLLSKITLKSFCLIPCSHQANQFQFQKAASLPCLFKPHLTSLSDIVICFTSPSFLQKYIGILVAKLSSCLGLPI